MNIKRVLIILYNLLKLSFKLNLLKTFYFNFKVLPIKQAIKIPFHFYGKVSLVNLKGEFVIKSNKISFGMIVFGGNHEVVITSNVPTRIYNTGRIEFEGKAVFARGNNIMVWNNGHLVFGDNFSIGSESKVICFREIVFKKNVLISWESQFLDTDFHFIISNEIIKDNCGSLLIEDNSWIGSREFGPILIRQIQQSNLELFVG